MRKIIISGHLVGFVAYAQTIMANSTSNSTVNSTATTTVKSHFSALLPSDNTRNI